MICIVVKKKKRKEIKEREREKTTTRYGDKARNVRITFEIRFQDILYLSFFFFSFLFFFFWFFVQPRQILFIGFARYRVSYVFYFFLDLMKGNAYYLKIFLPYLCIRIIKINHGRTSLTNVLFCSEGKFH